jgi:hypothetical protein
MATRMVNGESVVMTAEEEAAFEATRTPTLPQAKRAARERIRGLMEMAQRGGFVYAGARYDSRNAGMIAILANQARAGAGGFPVRMIDLDDGEAALSRAEVQAMEAALDAHLKLCSANAKTLRDAVAAAADVAAVRAVDLEAGWP